MPSLEESLLTALEEERRLSEERALLPGLLQHDLANVLTQVGLSAAMLSVARDDTERARYVRDIQGGVKRMNDLLYGMRHLFLTRGGAPDFGRGDLAAFMRLDNAADSPTRTAASVARSGLNLEVMGSLVAGAGFEPAAFRL